MLKLWYLYIDDHHTLPAAASPLSCPFGSLDNSGEWMRWDAQWKIYGAVVLVFEGKAYTLVGFDNEEPSFVIYSFV